MASFRVQSQAITACTAVSGDPSWVAGSYAPRSEAKRRYAWSPRNQREAVVFLTIQIPQRHRHSELGGHIKARQILISVSLATRVVMN